MTDVSKYKSVALSHSSCDKLDKIRKVIVPEVSVSRAKALDIIKQAEIKSASSQAHQINRSDIDALEVINKAKFEMANFKTKKLKQAEYKSLEIIKNAE